jgi:DNA-binding MarR family transcriptional regulator
MELSVNDDLLQSLGHLALGSRMKRAGVALQAVSQKWLLEQGCEIPATHMPVIAALHRRDTVTVGVLAQMLGIAQPGVSRMVDQMVARGWVISTADARDRRVRALSLTNAGKALAEAAERSLWPAIDGAVAALCSDLSGPFLAQMTEIETRLADGALTRGLAGETAEAEGTP